jgi:hypothetical protein
MKKALKYVMKRIPAYFIEATGIGMIAQSIVQQEDTKSYLLGAGIYGLGRIVESMVNTSELEIRLIESGK